MSVRLKVGMVGLAVGLGACAAKAKNAAIRLDVIDGHHPNGARLVLKRVGEGPGIRTSVRVLDAEGGPDLLSEGPVVVTSTRPYVSGRIKPGEYGGLIWKGSVRGRNYEIWQTPGVKDHPYQKTGPVRPSDDGARVVRTGLRPPGPAGPLPGRLRARPVSMDEHGSPIEPMCIEIWDGEAGESQNQCAPVQ